MLTMYHTCTRTFGRGWEHDATDVASAEQKSRVGKASRSRPVDESTANLVWKLVPDTPGLYYQGTWT